MKEIQLSFLIFFALFLGSCERGTESPQENSYSAASSDATPLDEASVRFLSPDVKLDNELKLEGVSNESTLKLTTKKIIKDGSISIETNNITTGKQKVDDALVMVKAYYETEELQNNDQSISFALKIRVPSESFEALITLLENGEDELKSKRINGRDVTEEFVDIETRLLNKRDYLKRYKTLLSKAMNVKEILEIEEYVRVLQEEIESKEGRLNYLKDQVAFSTLELYLYKNKEYVYKPAQKDGFFERAKRSLENSLTSIVDFTLWILSIWPIVALLILAYYIVKRVRQKRKKM